MGQPLLSVRRFGGFDEIGQPAWDALVAGSEFPSVFQKFGWLSSWWEAFAEPSWELMIIGLFDGDRLVGLIALYAVPGRLGTRVITFVGHPHADHSTVIVERNRADVVARAATELRLLARGRTRVEVPEVPEGTMLARTLGDAARSSLTRVSVTERTVCPRLIVQGNEQGVSEVLRKDSLKRHSAKLRKLGTVSVDHFTDPSEIDSQLDRFFDQHVDRWSVTPYPSLFRNERNRIFYRKFVAALAPEHVIFTSVRLNEEPVAFHLGFRSKGDFYWYKPTFDIRLSQLSPGEVLLRELFVKAAADGYAAFDFLRGDEGFKRRFANEYPHNVTFTIRASAVDQAVRRAADRAKTAVRAQLASSKLGPVVDRATDGLPDSSAPMRALRVGVRMGRDLASMARQWIYSHDRVEVWVAGPLADTAAVPPLPSVQVMEASLETFLNPAMFVDEHHRSDLLPLAFNRLRTGDKCYVALLDGRVVSYGWSSAKSDFPVTEVAQTIRVAPGEVMLYDFVTLPAYRGRGLYAALLQGIRRLSGMSRHWIFAESSNRSSLRGIERAGFRHAFDLERRIQMGRTRMSPQQDQAAKAPMAEGSSHA